MDSQSAALLRRLNPFCAQALEAAASLCQTRAHAEIQPEHWLLKLLEQGEGDITVIARRYEWDMDVIWQDLRRFSTASHARCEGVRSFLLRWKRC